MTAAKKTTKKKSSSKGLYPRTLLRPVQVFLTESLKNLTKIRTTLKKEDPFQDSSRALDNASPDADAAEQFGHARTAALREELDKKIVQTKKALANAKLGTYGVCEDCGKMIDTDRLMIYPEATYCASCQKKREK